MEEIWFAHIKVRFDCCFEEFQRSFLPELILLFVLGDAENFAYRRDAFAGFFQAVFLETFHAFWDGELSDFGGGNAAGYKIAKFFVDGH